MSTTQQVRVVYQTSAPDTHRALVPGVSRANFESCSTLAKEKLAHVSPVSPKGGIVAELVFTQSPPAALSYVLENINKYGHSAKFHVPTKDMTLGQKVAIYCAADHLGMKPCVLDDLLRGIRGNTGCKTTIITPSYLTMIHKVFASSDNVLCKEIYDLALHKVAWAYVHKELSSDDLTGFNNARAAFPDLRQALGAHVTSVQAEADAFERRKKNREEYEAMRAKEAEKVRKMAMNLMPLEPDYLGLVSDYRRYGFSSFDHEF